MAPRRFHLEGSSLGELKAQVASQYGPHALIVSAELVTVGGIRGFFASRHYEITVEVPEAVPSTRRRSGRRAARTTPDLPAASGIAALLDRADAAEAGMRDPYTDLASVSTDTHLFAALMDDLTFTTGAEPPPVSIIPSILPEVAGRPGDLTVVVGLGADPLRVARSMAASRGGARSVARAGSLLDHDDDATPTASDRLAAASLRAAGVKGGFPVFIAYGIDAVAVRTGGLTLLGADQVWIAVDAGRKPADTVSWVGRVASVAAIDGVAVEGAAVTATPETVNGLGLPIGWIDGRRAASPVL